ncbi:MAG: 30S ribosome-binding factor RbfA [Firmicutes bacterium]|nr:30S ribosome-binding factor RbfA [Bacillota bacterium]
MGKSYRIGRLGEEIRRIISNMLLTEIKDPRLQGKMISVTGVDVTSDGSYATCYVSVMGSSQDQAVHEEGTEEAALENQSVLEGLRSAAGLMRKEISRQVKVRHTPELIFKIDSSMAYGRHINKVISQLDIKPEEPESQEDEDKE